MFILALLIRISLWWWPLTIGGRPATPPTDFALPIQSFTQVLLHGDITYILHLVPFVELLPCQRSLGDQLLHVLAAFAQFEAHLPG